MSPALSPPRFLGRLCVLLFSLSVLYGSCGKRRNNERDLPRPEAARRPIRRGALIQLKAMLDFLWRVEMTQPEEMDNLKVIAHALSTFYSLGGVKEEPLDIFGFLYRFCMEATRSPVKCTRLYDVVEHCRRKLLKDLVTATKAFQKNGYEQIGSKSISSLLKGFKLKQAGLDLRMAAMRTRWPIQDLPEVSWCRHSDRSAMVVEANPQGIWVNGMAVMALEKGKISPKKEVKEGLQTLLVAGSGFQSEEKVDRNGPGERKGPYHRFILRLSVNLPTDTVREILQLASEVQLTHVDLRVRRRTEMETLCLLPLHVDTRPVPPEGATLTVSSSLISFRSVSSAPAVTFSPSKSSAKKLEQLIRSSKDLVVVLRDADLRSQVKVWSVVGRVLGKRVRVWIEPKDLRSNN